METREDRLAALQKAASERILIKDGPYGTEIQRRKLTEEDFRGKYGHLNHEQKGNNDLVNLTRADVIAAIVNDYLDAGADLVATNTFNANRISQADYGAESLVREINVAAAEVIRREADKRTAETPEKPRFVAGAMGPTNKTLSLSPDVNRPSYRAVTFDEMKEVYREQAEALVDGGVDLLLVETIFDTLNAKAALVAIDELFEDRGETWPVMVSVTITDLAGRNLSGQTPEAFLHSVRHAAPFSVGLNCSFGAEQLRPHIAVLSEMADTLICAYPNAGLPNALGAYDEPPEETARHLAEWAESGFLNIVGGCCGTTPEHIAAIAEALAGIAPRQVPAIPRAMRLSGLEAVTIPA